MLLGWVVIVGLLLVTNIFGYPLDAAAQEASLVQVRTFMEEIEDGKKIENSFEIWELSCILLPTKALSKGLQGGPSCHLLAVT